MKTLLYILFLALSAVSCKGNPEIVNSLISSDRVLPKIISYRLPDNSSLQVELSETAMLTEIRMRDIAYECSTVGSFFNIELPEELEMGVYESIGLTFCKPAGMIAKASLRLAGINQNLPYLLLNEVSVDGTKTNPDRIELKTIKSGNTAGMVLADGLYGSERYNYHLPELELKAGDLIVIYWDSSVKEERILKEGCSTYYLKAGSPTTMISTNGIAALLEREEGSVMDAVLYTDQSDEEDENPYGSEKLRYAAERMLSEGLWNGKPLDSSLITSSRVFARLPGAPDSKSEDDWFVTAARKSTFGDENIYDPYVEE